MTVDLDEFAARARRAGLDLDTAELAEQAALNADLLAAAGRVRKKRPYSAEPAHAFLRPGPKR